MDEAKAHPEVFANKSVGEVADHFGHLIGRLEDQSQQWIGHSFGGLITQMVAGRGLAAASVAIDPAPFQGVLPLPISSLKSAQPGAGQPGSTATGRSRSPTTSSDTGSPTRSARTKPRQLYEEVRRAGSR